MATGDVLKMLDEGVIYGCASEGSDDRKRLSSDLPAPIPLPRPATHGTVPPLAQRRGRVMLDKKPAAKPPEARKSSFLTSMDPEVIRRIKAAAALRDRTASHVLEESCEGFPHLY